MSDIDDREFLLLQKAVKKQTGEDWSMDKVKLGYYGYLKHANSIVGESLKGESDD